MKVHYSTNKMRASHIISQLALIKALSLLSMEIEFKLCKFLHSLQKVYFTCWLVLFIKRHLDVRREKRKY